MEISAFSCHGNPVHPDRETAAKFRRDFENTVLLAEQLGVNRIITFSGCPGDSEHEDSLMSVNEGLEKAVSFLKQVMISETAGEIWWA